MKNIFKIEFDTVTNIDILTNHSEEEVQEVMKKFEELPEFLDDSYDVDFFLNFLEENNIEYLQISEAETTLFFDRSKQHCL